MSDSPMKFPLSRPLALLYGQFVGDALGSLVEFRGPEDIEREYPDGVREMVDGGTWDTVAGQLTDDSEMALALARSLVEHQEFHPYSVLTAYRSWFHSRPFDCGNTVAAGLDGRPNRESQANGAMMRISPLALFPDRFEIEQLAEWARYDAMWTHPHPVCVAANDLYVVALAEAVRSDRTPQEIYELVRTRAIERDVPAKLLEVVERSSESPPSDFTTHAGWVLIAFGNALYRLLHAENFEEGLVATIMQGGDTDTNGAICGALLGAVRGVEEIPERWRKTVLECRPTETDPRVKRPRPEEYWPVDVEKIVHRLVHTRYFTPEELLEKVCDRESFIRFVEVLAAERERAERLERESGMNYGLGGALGWQNGSISDFLGASLIYLLRPESEPSWKMFADMLYFGKIYE